MTTTEKNWHRQQLSSYAVGTKNKVTLASSSALEEEKTHWKDHIGNKLGG